MLQKKKYALSAAAVRAVAVGSFAVGALAIGAVAIGALAIGRLGIRRMKESITKRAHDGASVVLSSHLLYLVEELCDTVLIIHHGRRAAYGTIADLKWQIGRGDVTLEDAFLKITETAAS